MTTYIISSGATLSFTVGVPDSEQVLSGGTASTSVISGGDATISGGGVASGSVVENYGLETVSSGGTTFGTSVFGGGVEYLVGGSAYGAAVGSAGIVDVEAGALASGAAVNGAGRVNVLGGRVLGTTLGAGAFQTVYQGTASGTAVNAGGTEYVFNGGSAAGTAIGSGGLEVIEAGGIESGTALAIGGTLDLVGLAYASGGVATLDAMDVLTISQGGTTVTQALSGNYAGEQFHLAPDATSGTLVTVDSMACYCAGTMILTPRGEMAVEALSVGDEVVTASGAAVPIRWIGRRGYAGRFLAGRPGLRPVVIRAGALGEGLPRRDLRVSPNHALFLAGVLVPAGLLVDGTTVALDMRCTEVAYIHLELAQHDLVFAEGALAETFLDDDSRGLFPNAAPEQPASGGFCARRVESGVELESVRRRLAETAGPRAVARSGRRGAPADKARSAAAGQQADRRKACR